MKKWLSDSNNLPDNPLVLFVNFWDRAQSHRIINPEIMTLATSFPSGRVSACNVLLKHFNEMGFQFFTNANSKKGEQLATNPNAALVIFWKEVNIQILIEGRVEKTSSEISN